MELPGTLFTVANQNPHGGMQAEAPQAATGLDINSTRR